MKKWLLILPMMAVVGCQPPMTRQEQLMIFQGNCVDYGYRQGTAEFAKCMKDQDYQNKKLNLEQRKVDVLEDQAFINRHSRWDRDEYRYKKYKHKKHEKRHHRR